MDLEPGSPEPGSLFSCFSKAEMGKAESPSHLLRQNNDPRRRPAFYSLDPVRVRPHVAKETLQMGPSEGPWGGRALMSSQWSLQDGHGKGSEEELG